MLETTSSQVVQSATQGLSRHSDNARAAPDNELQALSAQSDDSAIREKERSVYSQRNALSPTCVLPVEILSIIFYWTAYSYSPRKLMSHTAHITRLIKLTAVCRHWREVALADPKLWALLTVMEEDATRAWLKRSGHAPLHVYFSLNTLESVSREWFYPSLEIILEHMDRVRTLDMWVSSRALVQKLPDHSGLRAPAPLLEVLSLSITHDSGGESPLMLPPNLFSGTAPRLRKVHLVRYSLDWTSPILSNLTCISLSHIQILSGPTVNQILAIFAQCPKLEDIVITEVFCPDVHSSPLVDGSTISLPCLACLTLWAHAIECVILLNHISIPSNATLELVCTSTTRTSLQAILAAMIFLRQATPRVPVFDTLELSSTTDDLGADFSAALDEIPHDRIPFNSSYRPTDRRQEISLRFSGDEIDDEDVLVSVIRAPALKFSSVCELHVNLAEDRPSSVSLWNEIANFCPRVRELEISGFPNLVNASKALTCALNDSPDDRIPFPDLRAITIFRADFDPDGGLGLDGLLQCLSSRCTRGVKLQTLTFWYCLEPSPDRLRALHDVVTNLMIDDILLPASLEEDWSYQPYGSDEGEEDWSGQDEEAGDGEQLSADEDDQSLPDVP